MSTSAVTGEEDESESLSFLLPVEMTHTSWQQDPFHFRELLVSLMFFFSWWEDNKYVCSETQDSVDGWWHELAKHEHGQWIEAGFMTGTKDCVSWTVHLHFLPSRSRPPQPRAIGLLQNYSCLRFKTDNRCYRKLAWRLLSTLLHSIPKQMSLDTSGTTMTSLRVALHHDVTSPFNSII